MKKIILILVLCLISGCSSKNSTSVEESIESTESVESVSESLPDQEKLQEMKDSLPVIDENYFTILTDHTYCTIYANSNMSSIAFPFLSGQGDLILNADYVQVELITNNNQEISYNYFLSYSDKEQLNYLTYLSYQEIDWEKATDDSELKRQLDEEYELFSQIDSRELPVVYSGELNIYFYNLDQLSAPVELTGMKVTLHGLTYEFGLENFVLTPEKIDYKTGNQLSTESSAMGSDGPLFDDSSAIDGIELTAMKDVTITRVHFLDENMSIDNIIISKLYSDDDQVVEPDETFSISKENEVYLYINWHRDDLKEWANYLENTILLIDYEYNGQSYTIPVEYQCLKVRYPFEAYASLDENADYYSCLNYAQEMNLYSAWIA